jgi:hypothetical protein
VYLGSPGASYSNTNSARWGESRCEVDIIPIPPGVIPEVPLTAALPASPVVLRDVTVFVVRLKRRHRRAA